MDYTYDCIFGALFLMESRRKGRWITEHEEGTWGEGAPPGRRRTLREDPSLPSPHPRGIHGPIHKTPL
ncbi:MAG: hypothetical protein WC342_04515 [Methanoregula sp.]